MQADLKTDLSSPTFDFLIFFLEGVHWQLGKSRVLIWEPFWHLVILKQGSASIQAMLRPWKFMASGSDWQRNFTSGVSKARLCSVDNRILMISIRA